MRTVIEAHGLLPHGLLPHGLLPHGLLPHGLLPHGLLPQGLSLESLSIEGGRVVISVSSWTSRSRCPVCGRGSSRVHSRLVQPAGAEALGPDLHGGPRRGEGAGTEPRANPGQSITNAAERIAGEVISAHRLPVPLVWIEHYEDGARGTPEDPHAFSTW